jgi:epoxyqueuosine reductase
VAPDLAELAALDDDAFRERFRKSPVKRAKRRGLLRNVAIALGNSRDRSRRGVLERLCDDPDAVVREHALWALRRLEASAAEAPSASENPISQERTPAAPAGAGREP